MRFIGVLLVAVVVAVLSTPAAASAAPQPASKAAAGGRAMWLWSAASPATVVTWAKARGVTEIFAYVSTVPGKAELARLRDLRTRTKAAGIRLAALGGEPEWALDKRGAVTWRKNASATGLFDRIHLDVEPYVLPAWNTARAKVVSGYLAMIEAVRAAGREPLEADVPFWLSTIAAPGGNLADAVVARVDAITVMSYRDSTAAIVGVGTDLLVRARAARIPVRLAAETQPLADCPGCTFAQEGRAVMERRLAEVDALVAGYPTYAGFAVHHFDAWSRLRA